jgi:uncharacterized protein with HEPN domain
MRDFIIHNYDKIEALYIQQAIADLPNLTATVQQMLDDLPSETDDRAD